MSQNLSTGLTLCLIIAVAFLTGKMYSIESSAPSTPIVQAQTIPAPIESSIASDELKLEILRMQERLKLLDIRLAETATKPYQPINTLPPVTSSTDTTAYEQHLAELQTNMDLIKARIAAGHGSPQIEDPTVVVENSIPSVKVTPSVKVEPVAPSAEDLIRMERRAKGSLEIIEPRVNKYLNQKNYAKAYFQLGNFPIKLLNTPSGEKFSDVKDRVDTEISRDFKEQVDLSQEYVSKGQYPLAIDHLETLRITFQCNAIVFKKLNKEIDRLLKEYDDLLTRPAPELETKDPVVEAVKPEALNFSELIQQLSSDDYIVFKNAKTKLQEAGEEAMTDLISGTINDNANIRRFCITLLSQMGVNDNAKIEQAYLSALKDPEPKVCHAAMSALGKIISYEAVSPIIELVNKKNINNRIAEKAVTTFNNITDSKVPGARFLSADNVDAIQKSMTKYWDKNKVGKVKEKGTP